MYEVEYHYNIVKMKVVLSGVRYRKRLCLWRPGTWNRSWAKKGEVDNSTIMKQYIEPMPPEFTDGTR